MADFDSTPSSDSFLTSQRMGIGSGGSGGGGGSEGVGGEFQGALGQEIGTGSPMEGLEKLGQSNFVKTLTGNLIEGTLMPRLEGLTILNIAQPSSMGILNSLPRPNQAIAPKGQGAGH